MKQRSIILAVTCLWFLSAAVVALGPLSCFVDSFSAEDCCGEKEDDCASCCVSGFNCACAWTVVYDVSPAPKVSCTIECMGRTAISERADLAEGVYDLPIRPPIATC